MIAAKWLRRGRLALPAIGLAILVIMLARLDREAMLAQLGHISGLHVALATLMFVSNVLLKFIRWLRILRTYGVALPIGEGMLAFFASIFYGQVTIGGVGELTRSGALIARDVHWSQALVSSLFDRVLDVALLAVIGATALIYFYVPQGARTLALAALTLATLAGILGGRWLLQRCAATVHTWPLVRSRPSQVERLQALLAATIPLTHPVKLTELVAWTVIAWAGYMSTMLILADGLGMQASPWSVIAASALGGLTILLPISFQGVGTREPMFAFVLGREGVSQELAVLLAMLGFWIMFFAAIAIGLIGIAGQAARRRSTPAATPPAAPTQ